MMKFLVILVISVFSMSLLGGVEKKEDFKGSNSERISSKKSKRQIFKLDWPIFTAEKVTYKKNEEGDILLAVFSGNVHVVADLGGNRPYEGQCEKATYDYKKKTIKLEGWPVVYIGKVITVAIEKSAIIILSLRNQKGGNIKTMGSFRELNL